MSIDKVKAFYEKVSEDKELQSKLKSLERKQEEELLKIAKAAGFEFSADDLEKVLREKLIEQNKKLSETLSKLGIVHRCCHRAENSIRN